MPAISGDQSDSLDSAATRARSPQNSHPASMTERSPESWSELAAPQIKSRNSWSCWGCMASAAGAAYSQSGSYQRCGSKTVTERGLVDGKAGDVLGYEVLTYRSVDEPAQGCPSVDIGGGERRGDVIDCVCVGLVQPGALGRDVVGPRPDPGDGVTGCP